MAASSTGNDAPMEMPISSGRACFTPMAPVIESACTIPTEALADCSSIVNRAPARIPSTGFERPVSIFRNHGASRRLSTAPLMALMPNISTAKPSRISPIWWFVWFLVNMRSMMPTTAITPERVAVESSDFRLPPPSIYERQITQPVTLVPMIAPSITLTLRFTFIMPAFTKPTTITEVAQELWITAVTTVPSSMPLKNVPDSRYSISSSLLPATFFSPSPISVMPNRNSATPPSSDITSEIPIEMLL